MKKIRLLSLIGMASLVATGCSAVSDSISNQAVSQMSSEASTENSTSPEETVNSDVVSVNASNNDVITANVTNSETSTEVLTDTEIIDKESAIEMAKALWETKYGDLYTDYVVDLSDGDTTAELNYYEGSFFDDDPYWYVKVFDGEYGGFCAYINAVTGECDSVDQFK